MPCTPRYDADLDAIVTHWEGMVTGEHLRDALQLIFDEGRSHGTVRFLGDFRDMDVGHSLMDVFDLVLSVGTMPEARTMRHAAVVRPGTLAAQSLRFWETACTNRGLVVKAFMDMDAARAWLQAERSRR